MPRTVKTSRRREKDPVECQHTETGVIGGSQLARRTPPLSDSRKGARRGSCRMARKPHRLHCCAPVGGVARSPQKPHTRRSDSGRKYLSQPMEESFIGALEPILKGRSPPRFSQSGPGVARGACAGSTAKWRAMHVVTKGYISATAAKTVKSVSESKNLEISEGKTLCAASQLRPFGLERVSKRLRVDRLFLMFPFRSPLGPAGGDLDLFT